MNAPSSPVITRSLSRTVDDMLLDAGETDARLRSALLSLGSLRSLPVPEPGAELAAMLLSGPADQLARQRLLRRHRNSVVGLAVIAGMGLGVTGVAASGSVPDGSTNSSVQQMLADWSPAWTITGTPLAGPADGGPSGEMQVPGGPALADQVVGDGAGQPDTSGPGSNEPGSAGQGAPRQETTHQQKAAVSGQGDDSSSKNGDGGAAGKTAGGNAGGTGAEDAESAEVGGLAGKAGSNSADGQDKAGKSGAITSTVEEASTSLAKTGKTAAGKTDPGLIWLKKFSR